MRVAVLQQLTLLFAWAGAWGNVAAAQEGPPPPSVEAPPKEPAAPSRVEPDIYYLPDEDGNLRPVARAITHADLERAERIKRGDAAGEMPRFTIKSTRVSGEAHEDVADLTVSLVIELKRDGLARIPLGLRRAILTDTTYEGQGRYVLQYVEENEGYVCWLDGKADSRHKLDLQIKTPLVVQGEGTVLRLVAPSHGIVETSSFEIQVPLAAAVGRLSDGLDEIEIEPERSDGDSSTFVGNRIWGQFELYWQSADRPTPRTPVVLTAAKGAIIVRLDGPSVHYDVRRLSVGSLDGEFQNFTVRLPPGAELQAGTYSGYVATPHSDQDAGDVAKRGRLVDIRLDKPSAEAVDIRLAAEVARGKGGLAKPLELGGFEVVGAVRQWGYVAVEVVGDWHVEWGKGRNIRRVENLPTALQDANSIAGFEYFAQPFSLPARIDVPETRIRVEPAYSLHVSEDKIRLKAKLSYDIRGARAFQLTVQLQDWQDVFMESVVGIDADGVMHEGGLLTIPLMPSARGPLEIEFRAEQPVQREADAGDGYVRAALPAPVADTVHDSQVSVSTDDNVRAVPSEAESRGLIIQSALPAGERTALRQPSLVYRGKAGAVFSAAVIRQAQAIEVASACRLVVDPTSSRVEQTLNYQVDHEPIGILTLRAPRSLKQREGLEVRFGGQTLPAEALRWDADERQANEVVEPDGAAELVVALPPPARIGTLKIDLRFPIDPPGIVRQAGDTWAAPLFVPLDGTFLGCEATVISSPQLQAHYEGDQWMLAGWPGGQSDGELHLTTSEPKMALPLRLVPEPRGALDLTVISALWMQTWLTVSERQDRVCCRIGARGESLSWRLPANVDERRVEVRVDGRLSPVERLSDGQWAVVLPRYEDAAECTLEIRYRFPDRPPRFDRLPLEAPQFADSVWVRQTRWQLVLPRDETVLFQPQGAVEEYRSGFSWHRWGGAPSLEAKELAAWAGAAAVDDVTTATRRYVFAATGLPAVLAPRTERMSVLVLVASLLTLMLGLLFLYQPAVRTGWAVMTIAACLMAAGLSFPTQAMLAAQAMTVGIALFFVAALLKRLIPIRQVDVESPDALSKSAPRGSTRSYAPVIIRPASSAATSTAPMAMSDS